MFDPDGVIELLNDFPESFDDANGDLLRKQAGSEVFFGSDGQPTDTFLEALKKDWNMLPNTHPNQNNFNATLSKKNYSVSQARKRLKQAEPKSQRSNQRKLSFDSDDDSSSAKETKIKKATKEHAPRELSPTILINKQKKRRKSKKETNGTKREATLPNQPAVNFINSIISAEEVEQDAVRKSLQLRVAGQLNCIKLLQTKLKQSLLALQQRDSRLVQLEAKLKLAQDAAVSKALDIRQQQELQTANETIDRLKKQVQQLEEKLQEETARRLRSDERGRNWKEQADKHKARCVELEQKQSTDQTELSRQVAGIKKYKSAAKELAAEVAALRAAQLRSEQEATRRNDLVELAQQKAHEMQLQADRAREELKYVTLELHQEKQEKRELALQLQIAREKQALIATERRIQQRSHEMTQASSSSSGKGAAAVMSAERIKTEGKEESSHDSRFLTNATISNRKASSHKRHEEDRQQSTTKNQIASLSPDRHDEGTRSNDGVHSLTIQHIKEIAQRSIQPTTNGHTASLSKEHHPDDSAHHHVVSVASTTDDQRQSDNLSISTTGSRLAKIYSKLNSSKVN